MIVYGHQEISDCYRQAGVARDRVMTSRQPAMFMVLLCIFAGSSEALAQVDGVVNRLGTIRAKQGRLKEAESLFVRSIHADSRFAGSHLNLAYLYTLMGQPKK